jgi:outer membrane protein assembly factor BamB
MAAAAALERHQGGAALSDLGRNVSRTRRLAPFLTTLAMCALAGPADAAIPSWTTYHRDGARSGVDPDSAAALPPVQAWQTSPALDGDVYGQPLVYGARVYVATENDSVYSLDAATGAVVWRRSAGSAVAASALHCGNIRPTVGITSTPVIDPSSRRIYVVADTWDGAHASSIQHVLAGFNLADGSPAPGMPQIVDPPGSLPVDLLQRPGLALLAGRIVIAYGGNASDCGDYHGWLVSVPEIGGPLSSFEVEPNALAGRGAIWGAGNAPAIDAAGNVLVATGNGDGTPPPELQESVVKLDPMMNVLDSWTPSNWQFLDQNDVDLGSSEPLLLPGGLVFQIGKEGVGFLLDGARLGGLSGTPVFRASVCNSGFGGGTYNAGVIYVSCADGLHALSLNQQTNTFAPLQGWAVNSTAIGPPILAGGLVWSTNRYSGVLSGLDPGTGATKFSANLGKFDHFASPSAAGGKLFVGNGNQVTAFTIATPPAPSPTSTAIGASASPSPPGHPLTFTATVTPVPDAGTVAFSDGDGTMPGCGAIAVSSSTGQAACAASLAAGRHLIAAAFSGDPYYAGSRSDVLTQVIASPPDPRPRATTPALSRIRLSVSGTTIKLTLTISEPARLTVLVTQSARGRKINGRCVRHASRGKRCTLAVRKASRTFTDPGGRHSYELRLRNLRPGHYTLAVSASGASGSRSSLHRLAFTINGQAHR